MSTEYLTYEEKLALTKEVYEHKVRMAHMDERLKKLRAETRKLRWQNRWYKLKRFFGG